MPLPRRVVLALCVGLGLVPVAAAPEGGRRPPRILLDAGALYLWDNTSPGLAALPAGLIPGDVPAVGVVDPDDGRGVLVLRGTTDSDAHGRDRYAGEALLLAWSPASRNAQGLALAWTARFDGLPRAAAAAAGRAWVLSREPDEKEPGTGQLHLHEIDRTSGRVVNRASVPGAATSIAADPLGRRVYVALQDRILSLTTRPLVTSWHHRSPGANRALAVAPSGTVLAAARGREVALFDSAIASARAAAGRADRSDDATSVVPLPFAPEELAFSRDGRLLAAFGAGGLVFIAPTTGVVIWPETVAPLAGATELRPLAFPGAGRDLIVAAFPSGAVVALPAPEVPAGPPAGEAAETEPPSGASAPAAPMPPEATGPAAAAAHAGAAAAQAPGEPQVAPGPQPTPPPAAAPGAAATPAEATTKPPEPVAPPAAPVADPHTAPAPATPDTTPEATLAGTIRGDRARARAVVLYGPNSIVREFARVAIDAAGEWKTPLPPPGVYRLVAIGDGSTPIAVVPGFLTITVAAGEGHAGLDFTVGSAR
jgi:hypothetical protein